MLGSLSTTTGANHVDTTPKLSLPFLLPNQAQKHATMNTSLSRLDILVQLSALADDEPVQPAAPEDGDTYILPDAATGTAWGGLPAGTVACFRDNAWTFLVPQPGWRAWIASRGELSVHDGADWTALSLAASGFDELDGIGIGTTADETNRLSVASPATLFSHAGDDHRLVINKAGATDTASVIFQAGFSGRAEFGLAGDDDWRVKVSADGMTWHEALVADRASGRLTAPSGITLPGGQSIRSSLTALDSPDDAALELEGGGGLGRVALTLRSVGGLTGALFEQRSEHPADIDLIDFGFKTLSRQMNLRVESRTAFALTGAPEFQLLDLGDGTQSAQNLLAVSALQAVVEVPFRLQPVTVASLPAPASVSPGTLVFVSNETGGPVIAFNDGMNWRRVTDRAPVQA